ncbi:LytTR family transcriptional regulator DNA-binding domain-containing protein [Streptococcus sp. KHUD_011]|uniref:LytTR family transcriptional regulator DNA-binding domain-containing protein n=1 Tax=Streptococcus TaxID=1301 RepID=UPI001C5883C8|nr:LytTR family transcriptional regulator DNA-binding domain-containing protein [Streptococcus mitis]MBW3453438.1 LytTR family transcriptional regulator DNA-binding domain-containing protein [Streptococcus mitis]MDU3189564.1 LytTR family transcriptional regulator DNA-binding domain-containing protein [Streptococcus mitis]MDU7551939.1 LytTR family transcriptional regulator DNA-binding domain-containing protein [Streptococcus mitis]
MQDYILYQGRALVRVPLSQIYYVTTHPTKAHAVLFVTAEGNFEASTSLAKIEEESSEELIRCHRKFLVNKYKIAGFNHETRTIMFMDNRVSDISCSRRYFTILKNKWKKM